MPKKSSRARAGKVTPIRPMPAVSPLRRHYFDLLGDPMAFLADVSSLIGATDPRSYSPFGKEEPVTDIATFIDMVAQDLGVETTVLLRVLAQLAPDEAAARAAAASALRTDPVPGWVAGIADVEVSDVAWMGDRLGEGGNYLLEVRAPQVPRFTLIVYVDRVAGPLVKDAFYAEDSLDNVRHQMRGLPGAEQFVWLGADRAKLRGIVEHGIELSAMLLPPVETDSWPMSRAMTEWIMRALPDPVEPPEVDPDPAVTGQVVEKFLASVPGREVVRAGAAHDSVAQIGEMLASYAVTRGTGDPLQWCVRMVDDLLTHFWPRQVIAPHLDGDLPETLEAWIRFAHHETRVPSAMSRPVIDAVLRVGHEFLAGEHRYAGGSHLVDLGPSPYGSLEDVVGAHALQTLSAEPLPDEDFDAAAVPADLRSTVEEIRVLLDRASTLYPAAIVPEVRTAQRRLLARAAADAPDWFHRRAKASGSANAICWLIGQANGLLGQHATVRADELTRATGATGSGSQRAQRLQKLLGMPTDLWDVCLADAGLLIGSTRAQVLVERDEPSSG